MTPRHIRAVRLSERFMPKLWDFAYPVSGRQYTRARRVALRAWTFCFRLRVRLSDV